MVEGLIAPSKTTPCSYINCVLWVVTYTFEGLVDQEHPGLTPHVVEVAKQSPNLVVLLTLECAKYMCLCVVLYWLHTSSQMYIMLWGTLASFPKRPGNEAMGYT